MIPKKTYTLNLTNPALRRNRRLREEKRIAYNVTYHLQIRY